VVSDVAATRGGPAYKVDIPRAGIVWTLRRAKTPRAKLGARRRVQSGSTTSSLYRPRRWDAVDDQLSARGEDTYVSPRPHRLAGSC